ncbi:hypothetical protein QN355_11735 [Cryobacterium sp. 10S3]|uniref:hypothetical protein n=1 Tax=Cryobacterium sp. 10S3 TaxID=3048582 RepID=UPI002AC9647C|nr:hypothetical protein [Cryobacterium sp. 10S3]MEB0287225.1 hypothetical protein [Cryobacterium sp. 10S3]WPX14180.1 hypothetical protein RHM57_02055 [Cryobacterium sp. 10S3]
MANSNQKVVEGARLSGQGHLVGKLVEFFQDVFPHVKGEIKRLGKDELARIDEIAKGRNLSGNVYVERKLTSDEQAVVKADADAAATA